MDLIHSHNLASHSRRRVCEILAEQGLADQARHHDAQHVDQHLRARRCARVRQGALLVEQCQSERHHNGHDRCQNDDREVAAGDRKRVESGRALADGEVPRIAVRDA